MNLPKGILNRVVVMGLAVGLTFTAGARAAEEPGKIKVIKATGNVTAERKSDHKTAALKTGDTLEQGCVIQTGKGSSAVLLFANGSAITIEPGTTFSVDKFLQDPFDAAAVNYNDLKAEPSKSSTRVTISNGEIVGNMRKLNKGSSWDFNTPLGVAGIRGTIVKFTVTKDASGKVTVHFTAAEGTFEITPPTGESNKIFGVDGKPLPPGPLTVAADQQVTLTSGPNDTLIWTLTPLTAEDRAAIENTASTSVDVGPNNPFAKNNASDQTTIDNAVQATGDQGVGTLGTQIGGSGGGGGNGGSTPTPTPNPTPNPNPTPGS